MKKERDNNVIIKTILNKMLEKYNIDYEYILEHQEIEGTPWFNYYTLTREEYDVWKEWAISYLRSVRMSLRMSRKMFDEINLMWGLRIE
jgi:hypothetical protein